MIKKILLILLLALLPIRIYASSFKTEDMHIEMDEERYYVFTRDNIKDNEDLKTLNIPYGYMKNIMTSNNCYLDAIRKNADDLSDALEVLLVISDAKDTSNLHVYSDDEVQNLSDYMKERYETEVDDESLQIHVDKADILDINGYRYIYYSYYDPSYEKHVEDYHTIINEKIYTIKIQQTAKYTEEELKEINEIVKGITFDIDEKYEKIKEPSFFTKYQYLITALITVAILTPIRIKMKNKKKEEE